MRVAAWRIEADGPIRADTAKVAYEAHLEDWIERDPTLVAEGLRIVGRQVVLEGGRLDLLGVDPQGRLVLIEIKKGVLYRDALIQALDYAASISAMPTDQLRSVVEAYLNQSGQTLEDHPIANVLSDTADEGQRDILVTLVGTGRDGGLERIASFLAEKHGVPIVVVSFEVLDLGGQKHMLLREITEAETPESEESRGQRWTVDALVRRAEESGSGAILRTFLNSVRHNGLHPRPWKYSLMATPPSDRRWALFTVSIEAATPHVRLYVTHQAFSDFFALPAESVVEALGADKERVINSVAEAERWLSSLSSLLAPLRADDDGSTSEANALRPALPTRHA